MARALRRFREVVRWDEWYASKIAFVWTACATAALTSPLSNREILLRGGGVILFASLCGAFGYAANDLADRRCDDRAGKRSALSALSNRRPQGIVGALGAAAFVSLPLAAATKGGAALGLATLLLAAVYSLEPVRIKERGAAGLWAGAAAQRTLPVLLAFASLDRLGGVAWAFASVAQLAGLRAMLVHQVADASNDRRAGVSTYVTTLGEEGAGLLLRALVVPLEAAAICGALWIAGRGSPLLWLVAMAGAVASGTWALLSTGIQRPWKLDRWDRQPLVGFYELIWPAGTAALLVASRPGLWPLGAAFLVWQHRIVRGRIASALGLLKRQRQARGLRPSFTAPEG